MLSGATPAGVVVPSYLGSHLSRRRQGPNAADAGSALVEMLMLLVYDYLGCHIREKRKT